jgi:hypothetical protein
MATRHRDGQDDAILVVLAKKRQRGFRYNTGGLRLPSVAVLLFTFAALSSAAAQEPPPRIGPFVLDVHGTIPNFPSDPQLAASRGLSQADLPGVGLGVHAGAHVYVFKWKAMTVGLGGSVAAARAHSSEKLAAGVVVAHAVTEQFAHAAPELSFNFGNGNGWSYISGGIGLSTWSIVPDDSVATAADVERLRTINYGGGARWFIKKHLAFSFDVRFYQIDPGTPTIFGPGSPRTTQLIAGAGLSLK